MAPVLQGTAARITANTPRADPAAGPAAVPWALLALGFAVVAATGRTSLRAVALARQIRSTARVRRIGRVEIRVARVGPSCAIAWGRRAIVVLDAQTYADPDARWIVARHELIHHRHRDPQWAWAWAFLEAIALPGPVLTWLRRRVAAVEEIATDAAVVQRVDPRAYARVLIAAAARPRRSLALAVPADCRHCLTERLSMLALPRRAKAPFGVVVTAGLALQLTLAGVSPASTPLDVEGLAAASGQLGLVVEGDDAVATMLDRYVTSDRTRRFFAAALARRTADGGSVDAALAAAGLPLALAAVPLVESGFANLPPPSEPTGPSMAPPGPRGAGLWMFIPSTARTYGLQVDDRVDERMDVSRSTQAAIALLSDLHEHYGDWGLALAGYNQGQRHVDAAIDAHGTNDVWALIEAGALNDYAARVMAAVLLLENPDLVGS